VKTGEGTTGLAYLPDLPVAMDRRTIVVGERDNEVGGAVENSLDRGDSHRAVGGRCIDQFSCVRLPQRRVAEADAEETWTPHRLDSGLTMVRPGEGHHRSSPRPQRGSGRRAAPIGSAICTDRRVGRLPPDAILSPRGP
jgi:hypothetical protein